MLDKKTIDALIKVKKMLETQPKVKPPHIFLPSPIPQYLKELRVNGYSIREYSNGWEFTLKEKK